MLCLEKHLFIILFSYHFNHYFAYLFIFHSASKTKISETDSYFDERNQSLQLLSIKALMLQRYTNILIFKNVLFNKVLSLLFAFI